MGKKGASFEELVAQVYCELGVRVEPNKNINGRQLDLFVTQATPDGSLIRTGIECKDYEAPVGVAVASEIVTQLTALRSELAIDKGVAVASHGFTQDARTHLGAAQIECFTLRDLHMRICDFSEYLRRISDLEAMPAEYADVFRTGRFIELRAHSDKDGSITSIFDHVIDWINTAGTLLVLLGEYGSGKTTTAWGLAQKLAKDFGKSLETRIPIFIELKRFSPGMQPKSPKPFSNALSKLPPTKAISSLISFAALAPRWPWRKNSTANGSAVTWVSSPSTPRASG